MKIRIQKIPLKRFLQLFRPEDKIHVSDLGDTWHPSSGFVDEKILGDAETVQELLDFDYDFKGLVLFIATIDHLKIDYEREVFEITGDKKQLYRLIKKIEELNALQETDSLFEYAVVHY